MRTWKCLATSFLIGAAGIGLRPAFALDLVTHLFPHKDGEANYNNGGNYNPVMVVGANSGSSVAWITYQTGGADLSLTSGSSLTLYLDSLYTAGTLKIFALTAPVTGPEMDVEAGDLTYDSESPVATVALSGTDQEKIIRLSLGSLLAEGTFYGLVLATDDGLLADFGSKDSHLQPLIELHYGFATPAQVDSAIAAGALAQAAADSAGVSAASAATSASAAAGSATAAAASASSASSSATAASGSATSASTSATAAAGSATAAASSATSAAASASTATEKASAATSSASSASSSASAASSSASSASSSASSASSSASAASSSASAAASSATASAYSAAQADSAVPHGAIVFATTPTPPPHFTNTGVRINAEIPWINKTNLTSARFGSAAVALNGKVYLAGGINSSGTLFNAFQVFNPSTNAWTTLTNLPASITGLTMVESGGKLYAIGGRDGSNVKNTVYRYDTSSNTWSTMTAMTTARCNLSAVVSGGKIYVFGGCINLSNTMTAATEIYDIAGNSWSSGTSMPTAKASFTASLVDGKAYLIGGATASGVYTAANDVYSIAGNSWTSGRAMQRVREAYGSVVANGLIYLFGGYRASYIADCEQYDPVSDTYTNILSSNYTRAFPAAAYAGGKAYLMGGEDGTFSYTINEEYTIPTTLFAIQKEP